MTAHNAMVQRKTTRRLLHALIIHW